MKTQRNFILMALLMLVGLPALAQKQYQVASESKFTIAGTSTLHDWTMETSAAKGNADFTIENGKLIGIENLSMTVPTESLKSGKDAMDKNAYNALKSDEFPTIQFNLSGVDQLQQEDGSTEVICQGKLTIAGHTQTESIAVVCHTTDKGSLSCKGTKDLKMSTFNVVPPTFMFNTIKTGDDINITFQISFDLNVNNQLNLMR